MLCTHAPAGPTIAPERKVVFIRRFEEGRLVREDKLTHDEMKAIFKETWSKAKKVRAHWVGAVAVVLWCATGLFLEQL